MFLCHDGYGIHKYIDSDGNYTNLSCDKILQNSASHPKNMHINYGDLQIRSVV